MSIIKILAFRLSINLIFFYLSYNLIVPSVHQAFKFRQSSGIRDVKLKTVVAGTRVFKSDALSMH